jgi:2-dehydropantoate 2-reductase
MRYIVYGAGAIGGTIGASLFEAGRDVVLIARGEHGRAIAAQGLRFGTPAGGWRTLRVPVVERPARLSIGSGDVVVLSMKSQDTAAALEALSLAAGADVPVVCAQNGVENERIALRHFANVHGMNVRMPGFHLEPGVVQAHNTPFNGICDVGRYPRGSDAVDAAIAADFEAASILSSVFDDIMALKHAKLAINTTNVLEAAIGRSALGSAVAARAREEAFACFAAAGIDASPPPDTRPSLKSAAVAGEELRGHSGFQSLARGARLEADYLNGEIVLLGRLHGVPTPVNAYLQQLALRLLSDHVAPGSMSLADLEPALV